MDLIFKQKINEYLNKNWSVFPVQLKTVLNEDEEIEKKLSFPNGSWKRFQSEKIKTENIESEWKGFDHAGIATGNVSQLTVVDVDTLKQILPYNFPRTYTVQTRKGYHYYFKYNPIAKQSQNTVKNIDIRNDGGFVFCPPTKYQLPDGTEAEYKILVNVPLAEFPIDWYKETFKEKIENNEIDWKKKITAPIENGTRNMSFASIVGGLLCRFPTDDWEPIVWKMVQSQNSIQEHPLAIKELRTTYESICGAEIKKRNATGEVKNIETKFEDEEISIEISLEKSIVCFKIKNILSNLSEANAITWTNKNGELSYEIPFFLKIKSDSNKEQWVRILSKAFDNKADNEVYPWTIIVARVASIIEAQMKNKITDFVIPEVQSKVCEWLIEPFIQENQINTLFGMGSSGKTILSLYFATIIAKKGLNSMVIDFEDTAGNWKDRILKIMNIPESEIDVDRFVYFDSEQIPIAEQVDRIKAVIKKRNIKLVIVDSASLATGDSTSDEKSAIRLVSALKLLKTTILLIAHQRKNNGEANPIGSIQYENQSRNVWNIKGSPDDKDNKTIHLACTHTKANNTYLRRQPLGFKIIYTDDSISVSGESALAYFKDKFTVLDRIRKFLEEEGGDFTAKEIAKNLGDTEGSIKKNLTAGKQKGIIDNTAGKWCLKGTKINTQTQIPCQ